MKRANSLKAPIRPLSFLFFALLISTLSFAQVKVKFKLDVSEMVEKGIFFEDDRVFVRGTFNNWSGTNFELKRNEGKEFRFSQEFDLPLVPGDTIEYKFVIRGNDELEYWEANPNPDNPGYGNRLLELSDNQMELKEVQFDYGSEMMGRKLSPIERYQADFVEARKILEENHPALYDYSSRATLDSLFDHYYSLLDDQTSYSLFYQYLSKILAYIGCGHTKIFIPESYWNSNPDHFFPLQILVNKEEVLVKGSYGSEDLIPKGSKLLAINERKIDDIIQEMLPLESSDGFIHSFKIYSIQNRFPEKYAMMYGFPENYSVQYIAPGQTASETMVLDPVSFQQFRTIWKGSDVLRMDHFNEHNAAMITINTFGYYSEVPMFRAFVDSCFTVIKENDIRNLIIDLRGNDGGDPYCSSYLFSYLEHQAVPYFEESYHHYDTLAKPILLAENHYTGDVYVLIDGGGFSTTGHLCGLLEYHKLVTFVGTDLGSTYTCTGNTMYPILPNTQLFLGTARLQRYTAAVENMDPKVPVKANHFVEMSQDDLASDRDGQLQFILDHLVK